MQDTFSVIYVNKEYKTYLVRIGFIDVASAQKWCEENPLTEYQKKVLGYHYEIIKYDQVILDNV